MNKSLGLIVLGIAFISSGFAQQEMVLEGTYQGRNLYVQNPFASSGVGFCVLGVEVNGQTSIDEINSSAFEIDFLSYQLKKGQQVQIKIEYKSDCFPRVVNPEVLRPTSSFVITKMNVTAAGLISFKTKGESGSLPFQIEQFRWNKWVKVGEVKGNGTSGVNSYTFKAKPHSGKNKFRIKQVDFSRRPRYSREIRLTKSLTKVVVISNSDKEKVNSELSFSTVDGTETETMYEIFNGFGSLVKKGYGAKVDLSGLDKGVYYVNYDAKSDNFRKI